ncbi:MAG TPA: nitroreductase family protein [Patescibacteria group bacterium]|nr:nitroreductase family protein [Patescibacteria group bacterium]
MKELEFIYKRRSVRKFLDTPVTQEHLQAIIQAAIYAPSGKNLQNWHFVVVNNKEKIAGMARVVEEKNAALAPLLGNEGKAKSFRGMLPYATVFKNAPTVVLVYAGPYPTVADDLLAGGIMPPDEARTYAAASPGIQNIAAAMENLQLAAASLGYGTCWMTGPTYAAKEISDYIGFAREGYFLAAMTPLGIPAGAPPSAPARKPLEDVLTIIK